MVKKAAIVSLSAGMIGEDSVKHEVDLGLKRLRQFGLEVQMMPHAMSGIACVKEHPEDRAADLLQALTDDSVDMILCAIGGDDTYRLLPYLFENGELERALKSTAGKEKIFLGFSDSTANHLMLHKAGLNTFYGQSFLADICELDKEMLPYSERYFRELIGTGTIREIRPSDVWYEGRTDWSETALGTPRKAHPDTGFELLQGPAKFSGKILGGCLETLFDLFDSGRYPDSAAVCARYHLFPDLADWKGKILLLETSEEQSPPEHYRKMLETLKKTGIFGVISGIICGKPADEMYSAEYRRILCEVLDDPALPVAVNVNVGHAVPRCIIPFGIEAEVSIPEQCIRFRNAE